MIAHARIQADGEEVVRGLRPMSRLTAGGGDRRLTERSDDRPTMAIGLGRTIFDLACFHGRKVFKLSPPELLHRGLKKSPTGLAPEGLKSFKRLEPSRRAGGGDDGYSLGGKAKSDCADRGTVVVHVTGKKKRRTGDGVEDYLGTSIQPEAEHKEPRMTANRPVRVRRSLVIQSSGWRIFLDGFR